IEDVAFLRLLDAGAGEVGAAQTGVHHRVPLVLEPFLEETDVRGKPGGGARLDHDQAPGQRVGLDAGRTVSEEVHLGHSVTCDARSRERPSTYSADSASGTHA